MGHVRNEHFLLTAAERKEWREGSTQAVGSFLFIKIILAAVQ